MTKITDVAKLCNISVSTVSKVINGYPNVAQKTRDKVNKVIKETQFFPNSVARGLVKGRSMVLGIFLTTGMAHPYFVNVLSGMEQSLKGSGYDLIYMAQVTWDDSEYSFVKHCKSRNVDGVIVFGFQREDLNLDELIKEEIPTVFVDLDIQGRRAGYVCSDNRQGIQTGMEYLYHLGHRKIAFFTGPIESFVGKSRYEGYRSALQEFSLPFLEEYVQTGDYSKESGFNSMKILLSCSDQPTAVLCSSDMSAIGAIKAIQEVGLSVPHDFSVVGFDDIPLSEYVNPPITTIRQSKELIGKQVIEQLVAMIHEENYSPPSIEIPTELVIRQSCAKI